MLEKFNRHINSHHYFNDDARILIPVSGGVDSMVLSHLMSQANIQYEVSHINHNTRKGESDNDERFVIDYFQKENIKVHVHHIQHNGKGNFHDWAHNQRYNYWKSLDFDYILTAHHKDDHLETILINFFNGRSVSGIPSINGTVVRPLLPFTKEEILNYASEFNIPYVEDSSNQSEVYFRNLIRHTVKPAIIDSGKSSSKIQRLSFRVDEDLQLLNELVNAKVQVVYDDGYSKILKSDITGPTLLYHVLKSYGINRTQARQMFQNFNSVGNLFNSDEYEILVDRDYLLVKRLEINSLSDTLTTQIHLNDLPRRITFGGHIMNISIIDNPPTNYEDSIAIFPYRLLENKNVHVRYWNEGDIFYPFGMKGQKQSLKKYFANRKIDRFKKSSIPLFCVENDVAWVCGYRTDDRYRITDQDVILIKVQLL